MVLRLCRCKTVFNFPGKRIWLFILFLKNLAEFNTGLTAATKKKAFRVESLSSLDL
jgi:hypothetical protein